MFRRAVTLTLLLQVIPSVLLAAGIPILGRVLGPDGEAKARVEVSLEPIPPTYQRAVLRLAGQPGPEAVVNTRTSSDGTFELEAPEAGMWKVVVSARGMLRMEQRLIPLVEESVLPPLTLTPAADLEVRLVDAEGEPRPGAVGAYPLGLRGADWRPSIRLASAAENGIASLPLGRDETIRLEILAEGHPLVIYEVSDESSVKIDLPAGVARTVRITDSQKRPLPKAIVFQGSALLPHGLSDDEGRLSVVLQAKAPPALMVSTADRWNGSFELGPRAKDGEIRDLRLDPPTAVGGRVLDLSNQDPVAGALVWAVRGESAVTDKHGRYDLEIGVYKSRWMQAAAVGYQQGRSQVRDGDSTEAPAIALAPAAAIAGKVVDEAGKLLEGVAVELRLRPHSGRQMSRSHRMMRDGWHGRTSRRGVFKVANLPAGIGYLLTFKAEGYAPQELEIDPLEPFESRSKLEVVMRPGRLAFGRVIDTDEVPVAGARVVLRKPPPSDDLMVAMRMRQVGEEPAEPPHLTSADGLFEIADLAVGRYDLEVTGSGYAPITIPGVRIEEGDGQVDFGTVVLVPGATASGLVTDPEGAAIAGAEIFVDTEVQGFMAMNSRSGQKEGRTRTDSEGRFVVADLLPDQPVTIFVTKEGYGAGAAPAVKPPTDEPLIIVLHPAGRLKGRVVDGRGEAIRGATVHTNLDFRTMNHRASIQRRQPSWARTDAEGRFLIENVEPGTLQLSVNAPSYQQQVRQGIELAAGAELELEIVLEAGAVVEGTVLTADSEPVVQASISITEQTDGMSRGMQVSAGGQTDVEGRYRVEGAPTGSATISVYHADRQRLTKNIEVRSGSQIVDLVLDRGFEITGQVVDPDGTPVVGAALSTQEVTQAGMTHYSYGSTPLATSTANGTFTLTDVAAGKYTVSASREGFAPALSEPVEVVGNVSGVLLELRRGATLKGRVVGLELDELGALTLAAFSQQGGMRRGRVDFSSEYVFENLAAGQWHVQAQVASSGRSSALQVEVPEGVDEVLKDIEFGTGFTLTGIVIDGEQPLAGANITASSTMGSSGFSATGPDGRFRIENLKAGSYQVMVMSGMGIQHMDSLELSGDRDLRIEIATGAIAGLVIDAAGGEPVAGASVALEQLDGGDGSLWSRQLAFGNRSETDSTGRFQVPQVRQGSWRVVVTKPGFAPGEATVAVTGGSTPPVEIRMTPTEGVSFEVVLESGAMVPAVQVAILDLAGRRLAEGTHPVVAGKVKVSTVPPGQWELVVQGGDSAGTRFLVTAPGDQGRLVLPTGGTLQIRVPDLKQVPMASISLTGPDGKPFVSTMGVSFGAGQWLLHAGQTMVPGLTPGVWTFTVTNEDRTWSGQAAVTPGEMTEVVVP